MTRVEHIDNIAVLYMCNPPANAMDLKFCSHLLASFQAQMESDASAIVITGEGSMFSAGVDLGQLLEGGTEYTRDFLTVLEDLMEVIFFCPKPVVAAINGHAIAGGCILACCADTSLMAQGKGKIGAPELRVGVPFPVIIMEIVRAKLNPAHMEEIVIAGILCSPDQAKEKGLVHEVVEDEELIDRAVEAAKSLARIRPNIYSLSKLQVRQPVRDAIGKANKLFTADINALWKSDETREAIRDYMERTFKKQE